MSVVFSIMARNLKLFFRDRLNVFFSLLGVLVGVRAEQFDDVSFAQTFILQPLIFLGGVFYSVRQLPEPFRTVSLFNPVVHMVEGLRAGMLGLEQQSWTGLALLLALAGAATALAWRLLRVGYKMKS